MSLRVVVWSPAETDLLENALFIAENNPAAAQRFLDEAEKAFARLAEFSEIGTPRTVFDPSLGGLEVLRVTNAARRLTLTVSKMSPRPGWNPEDSSERQ